MFKLNYFYLNKLQKNTKKFKMFLLKGNKKMRYILASKSPRRKELLQTVISDFEIIDSNFDEDSIKCKSPRKLVTELSKGKCKAVFGYFELRKKFIEASKNAGKR